MLTFEVNPVYLLFLAFLFGLLVVFILISRKYSLNKSNIEFKLKQIICLWQEATEQSWPIIQCLMCSLNFE